MEQAVEPLAKTRNEEPSQLEEAAPLSDEQPAEVEPAPRTRPKKRVRNPDFDTGLLNTSATRELPPLEDNEPRRAVTRAQTEDASEPALPADENESLQSAAQASAEAPAEAAETFTWEIAARRLKELGVKGYRFERTEGDDGFIFSCSLVRTGASRVERRFEAVAEEQLPAVRKVIRQIEDWQARQ